MRSLILVIISAPISPKSPLLFYVIKTVRFGAFSRTCRHRGACVVEGSGNARFFRCPFHGWTYDLRGNLIAARQMDQTTSFDQTQWPLTELKAEVWEGLIFINFDADAAPLTPRLTGASEALKNYRLSDRSSS